MSKYDFDTLAIDCSKCELFVILLLHNFLSITFNEVGYQNRVLNNTCCWFFSQRGISLSKQQGSNKLSVSKTTITPIQLISPPKYAKEKVM